jgi:hypothetical protein
MAVDPDANDRKRRAVAALIAKLWSHHWVPQMPQALRAELMIDWVSDLEGFDLAAIEAACANWRRSSKPGFPKPGQLIALARDEQQSIDYRRRDRRSGGETFENRPPQFGESRPLMWWTLPAMLWRPHWRASEIPEDWRTAAQEDIA